MKTNLLILFIGALLCFQKAAAQSSQTNFSHPWSATSQAFPGSDYPFHDPSEICSDHHQYTSSTAMLNALSGQTEYLVTSNFGLSLPLDASICGIEVKIVKSATGINLFSWVKDNTVRLVKNGVITGENKASSGLWTLDETTAHYGGATDQWAGSWTVADLLSPGFGVAFSARLNGAVSLLPSARIHSLEVKVYYNVTLPLRLVSFEGQTGKSKTAWNWKVASLEPQTFFALQRSANNKDWEEVQSFYYSEKATTEKRFAVETQNSPGLAYYRLKVIEPGGKTTYSDVKRVMITEPKEAMAYPNPARDFLFVKTTNNEDRVLFYDLSGKIYQLPVAEKTATLQKINLQTLSPGYYLAVTNNARSLFRKE